MRSGYGKRAGIAAGLLVPCLLAALSAPAAGAPQRVERRVARAVRTPTPPEIDGVLDDLVWDLAQPIGELVAVLPVEGAEPSQPSDVRILYDDDHLYVGMRFYDDEPEKITAFTKERDGFLDESDYSELYFDTFLDRRNAFFFQINPAGSRGDALITNNGADFNKPWDGIWDAETRVDELGWVAELILPFKTLNFDPEVDRWGFNVTRNIGRTRERCFWNDADRDHSFFQIYHGGDLVGLEGIDQGVGLDVSPFFVGTWRNERELGDTDLLGDEGLDAYYNVTPSLNLSLTYNTDFAEAEVDDRQINLTRFPLFFPERRDFFLEDAGIFEVQGPGRSVIPFFSRRIGLAADGSPVPILGGAKLTGRVGGTNLGVLGVATDSAGDLGAEGQELFAARVSQNVGERSTVGGIFTRGDPLGGDDMLYGVDMSYATSEYRGDKNLEAGFWFFRDDSDDSGDDDLAFGARVSAPNDITSWYLTAQEIQPDFDPALGFVPRRDVRQYNAGASWEPRPGTSVRQLEFSVDAEVFTDTDDRFQTLEATAQPLGVFWESGESLRLSATWTAEDILVPFTINDVEIPAGDYEFGRYRLAFATADRRSLRGSVALETGDFFGGTRDAVQLGVEWQPGATFNGALEGEQNEVDLPGGDFTTRLARARFDFLLTPDLSWRNFVQWDSVSDSYGLNSRLRWIPEPGNDVFVVFNQTLQDEGGSLLPTFQGLTLKVVYTLRF